MSHRAGARQTKLGKSLLTRLTDGLRAVKPLKAMGRERLLGPLLEGEARRLNRAFELEMLSKAVMRTLQEPLIVVGARRRGLRRLDDPGAAARHDHHARAAVDADTRLSQQGAA